MANRIYDFWLRRTDFSRLFGAGRICYLIGGYNGASNYGDIAQLAANIERLRLVAGDMLPVPVVHWRYLRDHESLCKHYPGLFGDACFLYARLRDAGEVSGEALRDDDGLLCLPCGPSGRSRLLVYGGGFFNRFWGETVLDLIESCENWVRDGGTDDDAALRVLILGQQISRDFPSGPHSERFIKLLRKAAAIGVRDTISFEVVAGMSESDIVAKLFVSGDDAVYCVWAAGRSDGTLLAPSVQPFADSEPQPLTVNVHLSLEDYVTQDAERLFQVVVCIVKEVHNLCRGNLAVNLIVGYADQQISEEPYARRLAQRIQVDGISANTIAMVSELAEGFPSFRRASLTICCSYHVALTSLLFCVPTILLYSNDYYEHKHKGLQRDFQIPEELVFDLKAGNRDKLVLALQDLIQNQSFRGAVCERIAGGVLEIAGRASRADLMLAQFATSHPANAPEGSRGLAKPAPTEEKGHNGLSAWDVVGERIARAQREWFELREARWRKALDEQQAWVHELEQGKAWLEQQWQNWRSLAEERERVIQKQLAWIRELETAKAWLEEHWANWRQVAEERESLIMRQSEHLEVAERELSSCKSALAQWSRSVWVRAGLCLGLLKEPELANRDVKQETPR